MALKTSSKKLQDNLLDGGTKHDYYWDENGITDFYKLFRSNFKLPSRITDDTNSVERLSEKFNLKGIQFGNWLTNEDKFNYLAAFYISLHDMNRVLRFGQNNMGIGSRLGLSMGARGIPGAIAHFESQYETINITRYKRADQMKSDFELFPRAIPKMERFLTTGGAGALAHEYGHFLDYVIGRYYEQDKSTNWITGKYRSVSKKRIKYPKSKVIHNLVEDLFEQLFWKKGYRSDFSNRIKDESEYINRRLEVFARIFEQYIDYKLKQKKINNDFLSDTKYVSHVYLKPNELKAVIPIMDKIVKAIREKIK